MDRPSRGWRVTGARLARVGYRIGQFLRGLVARPPGLEERALVEQLLPAPALALFQRMPADAQRHSLNVLHTLQTAGWRQPDLAAAALLHDVGKVAAVEAGLHLNFWWRGPLVLLDALAPRLLAGQARNDVRSGWRYALYVHLAHPQIGAAWVQQAGCGELVCWLIEHHQNAAYCDDGCNDNETKRTLLSALQWADGRN